MSPTTWGWVEKGLHPDGWIDGLWEARGRGGPTGAHAEVRR